ncbi:MAG: ArnT family glycosyltransferase [Thermoguttaceae bacterium]
MPATPKHPANAPLPRTVALGLILAALAVRLAVLGFSARGLADDPDGYRAVADNLLRHGTFGKGEIPTAYRPPLYPLVLVPCLALGPGANAAIALLHVALGVATVWLTFRLGERWGLGRWGLLAAGLVACDPILLRHSALIMTETLAAFLAAAALVSLGWAASRPACGRAALAGAWLGLAALCRPAFLAFLAGAAVPLACLGPDWHGRLKRLLGLLVGAGLVLAPWAARNQLQFGRPMLGTTHGGYTLWLANNPDWYQHLRSAPWGSVWDASRFNQAWLAEAPAGSPANELAADRLAYARAMQTIRRQPGMFAYACLVRVGRLWSPLPHRLSPEESAKGRLARFAVALWYTVQLALALVGLVWWLRYGRRGSPLSGEASPLAAGRGPRPQAGIAPDWVWGVLLVGAITGVHTVYWTDMRMRAPLMPVVALAAAAGAAWLAGRPGWFKWFCLRGLGRGCPP